MKKSYRLLKLQCFFSIPKKMYYRKPVKIYPQLLLKGKWLEEAGFKPDSTVLVQVHDGRLVIEPFVDSPVPVPA